MNGEQIKTVGALASPLLAIAGLAWGVSSWLRAGSRLRIHALLYREVLVLWVFNAGRTTTEIGEILKRRLFERIDPADGAVILNIKFSPAVTPESVVEPAIFSANVRLHCYGMLGQHPQRCHKQVDDGHDLGRLESL
jgi:hypothetical protein